MREMLWATLRQILERGSSVAGKKASTAFANEASIWLLTWARTRDFRINRCMARPSAQMSVNVEARPGLLRPHRSVRWLSAVTAFALFDVRKSCLPYR